jgi:hypothetical protein
MFHLGWESVLAVKDEDPLLFRRVEIWDAEKEEAIVFLSNLLAFGATSHTVEKSAVQTATYHEISSCCPLSDRRGSGCCAAPRLTARRATTSEPTIHGRISKVRALNNRSRSKPAILSNIRMFLHAWPQAQDARISKELEHRVPRRLRSGGIRNSFLSVRGLPPGQRIQAWINGTSSLLNSLPQSCKSLG